MNDYKECIPWVEMLALVNTDCICLQAQPQSKTCKVFQSGWSFNTFITNNGVDIGLL